MARAKRYKVKVTNTPYKHNSIQTQKELDISDIMLEEYLSWGIIEEIKETTRSKTQSKQESNSDTDIEKEKN